MRTAPTNYDRTPRPLHEILVWIEVILFVVFLLMAFGVINCSPRYDIRTRIMDCQRRPAGNLAFPCKGGSGWCAGLSEYQHRMAGLDDLCIVSLCEDRAAERHERCHCRCEALGENGRDGSPCMERCGE